MLNGFDPMGPRFLADLNRIQERSTRAERQITSGLRVETASDDPEGMVEILRVMSRIENNTQVQTNLTRVKTQVDTAEGAMRQAVAIVEQARILGAQNGGTDAVNRKAVAAEVQMLHDRLLALVSTSAEGRFVFASDGLQGPPYVADAAQPNGVRLVAPSRENTTLVADENQTTFDVSRTASELFDATGPGNAFQALQDLITGLTNDSGTEVSASMAKIEASLDHLNGGLAFYGAAQNRVDDALTVSKKNYVSLQANLARLRDTDLPAAILELNNAKMHHEIALAAHANFPKSSLFDYLG
jgi:flagellar hook-associated protein 3 FlgL